MCRTRADARDRSARRKGLAILHEAGLETVLLKGAAVAPLYYPPEAPRGMVDVDVLVRWEDVPRAARKLCDAGWIQLNKIPSAADVAHAIDFVNSHGHAIDLHWFSLMECRWPGADDGLWRRTVPATLYGVPTRVPVATDLLWHLCLHGARHDSSPWGWTSDAVTLLNVAGEQIDWDRIVDEACERRMVPAMASTLRFLRDQLDAAVPLNVLERLDRAPVSISDRLLFHIKTHARPGRFFLLCAWLDYLRFRRPRHWPAAALEFPRFLQDRWGLQRLADLPAEVHRRVKRFLSKRRRSRSRGA